MLSRIVFKDTVSNARLAGIAAIIMGLLNFIFRPGIETGDTLFGDLLFIGSGIMFSAYAVLVRRWTVDPVTATATIVLLSCLLLPPLHIFTPSGLNTASAVEIGAQIVI
ncbi:hypothetical protein G6L26_027500 (plasmid) [Agrobacterium radiobacter]|uniref:EamA domain-containing protein n=1 Tax=Agrobacterium tumefaciens str. B6 TaxID=1183423 RepID=A0A822VBE0_AGRTU|nr:hypothetical protein [Agrobacterium tumefaciens]CVI25245.1 conserved membrane hypothetical protein [Agrobacterium tumefaciens str. B6]